MESPQKLFVMAGMPRAGTTYIYQALQNHTGVYLTYRKELGYFSTHREKGESWYRSLFDSARSDQICGDISPDYFLHADAPIRIAQFNPRPKVIIAVRDPASWAVSYHRHIATFERRVPPFAAFLERHPVPDNRLVRLRGSSWQPTFSIVDSLVSRQLDGFRRQFGADLLLYSFDLFRTAPVKVMQAIEGFLGLTPMLDASNLPPDAINASRRPNARILTYLLSREELISTVDRIVPRELLRSVRNRFDRIAAVPSSAPVVDDPSYASDLAMARERLESDRRYVTDLFRNHQIQLGNGHPVSPA